MLLFEFTETLLESAHDILFHATSLEASNSILKNKEFELGFSLAKAYAEPFRPKGTHKYFYLSTARSPSSGFISMRRQSSNPQVLFQLNGEWFNKKGYVTKPVDYFNGGQGDTDEMEDRVFSKEPTIKFGDDAKALISAIHILVRYFKGEPIKELLPVIIEAKRLGIPFYVYDNGNAWLMRRKEKAIPYDQLIYALNSELKNMKKGLHPVKPSVFAKRVIDKNRYKQAKAIEAKRTYKALLNLITAKSPDDIKEDTYHIITQAERLADGHNAMKQLFVQVKAGLGSVASNNIVAAIKKSGIKPDGVLQTLDSKWMGLSYGLGKQFKKPTA